MMSYTETVITEQVKACIAEERKLSKWVHIAFACVFLVYVCLALWIASIAKGIQDTDNLKREAIRELVKEYNDSLEKWNNSDTGKTRHGTQTK